MMEIPRRRLLAFVGSGVLIPTTGCQGDFPPSKRLGMHIKSTDKRSDEWEFEMAIFNDTTVDSHSADFHDVQLRTYSTERELIQNKSIGDIPYTRGINDGIKVTEIYDSFPYLFALQAQETPCDEETSIQFRYYTGDELWQPEYRNCNEGLPPDRRDGEPETIEMTD